MSLGLAKLGPILSAVLGATGLLILYFTVLTLVSGWSFTQSQFAAFWYFVIALAVGFGAQVGLYTYLKKIVHSHESAGRVVAVSGTTSTAAMVSCCAHYLLNVLPIIGVTGLITVIAQYQIQLFWLGLAANFAGIFYLGRKVLAISKM